MQRRNFILGLGTVATLSGAASVTGASLASTNTAQSDFRVITDSNVLVIQEGATGGTEEGSLDFGSLSTDDGLPQSYVEGAIDPSTGDDDLTIEIATENDSNDDQADIIEVDGSDLDQDVAIQVNFTDFGVDVGDGAEEVGADTVADIYSFEIEDGGGTTTDISPTGDDGAAGDTSIDSSTSETVTAGEVRQIAIGIDTTSASDEIADATDSENPFSDDDNDIDLLDEIEFETTDPSA